MQLYNVEARVNVFYIQVLLSIYSYGVNYFPSAQETQISFSGTEISEHSFYKDPKLGIHQYFPASN